jgi:hypothetical protein
MAHILQAKDESSVYDKLTLRETCDAGKWEKVIGVINKHPSEAELKE